MKVTAKATRSGDWWAIEVPEVPGVFTQAKRLDQVADMVADAVALMEDLDANDIEVEVDADVPKEVAQTLLEAQAARSLAGLLEAEASQGFVTVASELVAQGYTLRDVAVVLGVSHQRVGQLVATANAPDFVFVPQEASIREITVPDEVLSRSKGRSRSAVSGRFVSKSTARKSPSSTVIETRKRRVGRS